jgi:hypothetical protein
MKEFTKFLWITFLILGSMSVNAQVNVGSPDAPHEGAAGEFIWIGSQWRALAIDGEMMTLTKFNEPNGALFKVFKF